MYLFVYGTLKRGCPNCDLLMGADFICSTYTANKFTMLDFGIFPGVVEGNASQIYGELYDIDSDSLESVDKFEGEWFNRDITKLENGVNALMYYLVKIPKTFQNNYNIVENGNWEC
ncbi:MAG: gamma-glutamylcyclotransferase [Methanohalobium sp.]|uniref:gamma-glutamylcyclotransferase family protein n=1 Tax=Methanohalobium sp. TaxID=2837493 RepID=UPI0039796452